MGMQHWFAGGNTADGFDSCFDDILPRARRKRMFYIKGGPGVGKSTLMRSVAQRAEAAGECVEYYHCSSDPDSLDGICLPQRGLAMMDGTAPHVYDPSLPGARDTLLSLGDYLDEASLRPHAQEIDRVQREISARFARCYRYLAAARQVRAAAAAGAEDERKAWELAGGWADTLPLRGGKGTVRRLFAEAYTPKGRVSLLDSLDVQRRITVETPFGCHATQLLRAVCTHAVMRGLHAVQLSDALDPTQAAHVYVPSCGVLFTTAEEPRDGDEWVSADRLFEMRRTAEHEERFDRNACELLQQRAVEQLAAAKALHDELERFYVGNMDFLKWQTTLEGVLEELKI